MRRKTTAPTLDEKYYLKYREEFIKLARCVSSCYTLEHLENIPGMMERFLGKHLLIIWPLTEEQILWNETIVEDYYKLIYIYDSVFKLAVAAKSDEEVFISNLYRAKTAHQDSLLN
jgi:hypothetical protein